LAFVTKAIKETVVQMQNAKALSEPLTVGCPINFLTEAQTEIWPVQMRLAACAFNESVTLRLQVV